VSEHQPTTWSTYFFDLNFLVFAAPAGLYYCFKYLGDQHIFLLVFALTSIYFSGIMIRWAGGAGASGAHGGRGLVL
jgi:dolichyl-diphosphooligosaccharide--protein glycosyltransferase